MKRIFINGFDMMVVAFLIWKASTESFWWAILILPWLLIIISKSYIRPRWSSKRGWKFWA